MKIRPIEDRIVVLPVPADTTSAVFYEHSKATEKPMQGIVQAVGPGKYLIEGAKIVLTPMDIKEGETVLYGKHTGTDITVDGISYVIMRLGDAYAIL